MSVEVLRRTVFIYFIICIAMVSGSKKNWHNHAVTAWQLFSAGINRFNIYYCIPNTNTWPAMSAFAKFKHIKSAVFIFSISGNNFSVTSYAFGTPGLQIIRSHFWRRHKNAAFIRGASLPPLKKEVTCRIFFCFCNITQFVLSVLLNHFAQCVLFKLSFSKWCAHL